MKLLTDLFSPYGVLERRDFYVGLAVISGVTILLRLAAESVFPGTLVQWAPVVIGLWGICAMTIKRLRDMGASPRRVVLLLAGVGFYGAGVVMRGGSPSDINLKSASGVELAGSWLVILGAVVVGLISLWLMFTPSKAGGRNG